MQQTELNWSKLNEYYGLRNYQPLWVNSNGPLPRAHQLRALLAAAEQEGLNPQVYHPQLLQQFWSGRLLDELARLDLILTDAFFRYSIDLQGGELSPNENEFHWHITTAPVDAMTMLDAVLDAADFVQACQQLAPSHPGYQRLRKALQKYRQLAQQGGWPHLPAGPLLRDGYPHAQVRLLRQRLIAEGDLQLGPVKRNDLFDQAVKFAVERFQVRHGLPMDGIVGPATRAVMNISVQQRIEQIKLNMQRWRWLPRQLGKRYIMVNTAGFELAAIENERTQFTMWVIVGTAQRPTPVVQGMLHTVVFHPYWTVPSTIVFEDIVPKQQRDPDFLHKEGIRIFSNRNHGHELQPGEIDWNKVDSKYFPYILRQDPGPSNPLGRIKFLFSNKLDVYLHDTPRRQLFEKKVRTFSSGCIRVAKPERLARYLIGDNNGWTEEKIAQELSSGQHLEVPVSGAVPIYLVYLTAWVGENFGVHFRQDVYGRDLPHSSCS